LEKLDYQKLGMFTIVKHVNIVAFQLKFSDFIKIHPVFRVSLLEPSHAFTIPRNKNEPPPPIIVNGEQEYEVEKILNSRYHIINYNILFIGKVMTSKNVHGNQSRTYKMPWKI